MKWKRLQRWWTTPVYISGNSRWEIEQNWDETLWELWAPSNFLAHVKLPEGGLQATAELIDGDLPTLAVAKQLAGLIEEHQPEAWNQKE